MSITFSWPERTRAGDGYYYPLASMGEKIAWALYDADGSRCWTGVLSVNLCFASLLGRSADQVIAQYPCPVRSPEAHVCIHKLDHETPHRCCDGWWL